MNILKKITLVTSLVSSVSLPLVVVSCDDVVQAPNSKDLFYESLQSKFSDDNKSIELANLLQKQGSTNDEIVEIFKNLSTNDQIEKINEYIFYFLDNLNKLKLVKLTENEGKLVEENLNPENNLFKNNKIVDFRFVNSHEPIKDYQAPSFEDDLIISTKDKDENTHNHTHDKNDDLNKLSDNKNAFSLYVLINGGWVLKLDFSYKNGQFSKMTLNQFVVKFNEDFNIREYTNWIHIKKENEAKSDVIKQQRDELINKNGGSVIKYKIVGVKL